MKEKNWVSFSLFLVFAHHQRHVYKTDNFHAIVALVSCHNMFLMIMNHPIVSRFFFPALRNWLFNWNERHARERRIVESENEFCTRVLSVFCHVKSMTCYLTSMFTHSIFTWRFHNRIHAAYAAHQLDEQIKRLFSRFFSSPFISRHIRARTTR